MAGKITVRADQDIDVASGALVSARGLGLDANGGNIVVFAQNNATLAGGATIDAGAGATGDGGFLEFSAKKDLAIRGGKLAAGALGGLGGTILIDPENLLYEGAGFDDFNGNSGVNYVLQADKSIVLKNVFISTRRLAGNATPDRGNVMSALSSQASGNITLTAPSITLKDSTLVANSGDKATTTSGVVLLKAEASKTALQLGLVDLGTGITLENSTIKGDSVELSAKTTVDSRHVYVGDSVVGLAQGLARTGASAILKVSGVPLDAELI